MVTWVVKRRNVIQCLITTRNKQVKDEDRDFRHLSVSGNFSEVMNKVPTTSLNENGMQPE